MLGAHQAEYRAAQKAHTFVVGAEDGILAFFIDIIIISFSLFLCYQPYPVSKEHSIIPYVSQVRPLHSVWIRMGTGKLSSSPVFRSDSFC